MQELYERVARRLRYDILESTTTAGSGHLTSSLSSVELMTVLLFGKHFLFDILEPQNPNNDRLIFSKGHAAPLYYALWAMAGAIEREELNTLRKFGSRLEGHPTMYFPYTEVATGSLGIGLSVGVGMALNAHYLDALDYRTWILLGDSEMAEGSNWEAIQVASYYKLDQLVGIIDVNRLGQTGETMYGSDVQAYADRISAFGWHTIIVDGHDVNDIDKAYQTITHNETPSGKPVMIIAQTIKGKGVAELEDKNGFHGKTLPQDECLKAQETLGDVEFDLVVELEKPLQKEPKLYTPKMAPKMVEDYTKPLSVRKAYGHSLVKLHEEFPEMVVLDAEVSNSTYASNFKEVYPERFFEMFIAEQNMVGVAIGLAARGKLPFVSTFGSFFTRALDQIRISQYSRSRINFVGSHVGVSIGEDGATQMALEDIAIFRAIVQSVIVYPADHVSEEKLTKAMIEYDGITYMRTTRAETETLYSEDDTFEIGGSKTLRESSSDDVTIVAAGITLYEALKAYDVLKENNVMARIIDVYSVKPIDNAALKKATIETKAIFVVEDHFADGGIADAVRKSLSDARSRVYSLAVTKMPRSGKPHDLLVHQEIDADSIVRKVLEVMKQM